MKKTKNYAMEISEKRMYDIQQEHLELIHAIEYLGGEITPEVEEALEINTNELEVKSMSYLGVISNKKSENTLISEEIKRLQTIKKRNNNSIEFLESMLLRAVNVFGSFKVGLTNFSIRRSQSITVEDVNSLKSMYKTIKIVETPDKMALKNALKSGVEIQGVELVDNLNLKIN